MKNFREQVEIAKGDVLIERAKVYESLIIVAQRGKNLRKYASDNRNLASIHYSKAELAIIKDVMESAMGKLKELDEIEAEFDRILDEL